MLYKTRVHVYVRKLQQLFHQFAFFVDCKCKKQIKCLLGIRKERKGRNDMCDFATRSFYYLFKRTKE